MLNLKWLCQLRLDTCVNFLLKIKLIRTILKLYCSRKTFSQRMIDRSSNVEELTWEFLRNWSHNFHYWSVNVIGKIIEQRLIREKLIRNCFQKMSALKFLGNLLVFPLFCIVHKSFEFFLNCTKFPSLSTKAQTAKSKINFSKKITPSGDWIQYFWTFALMPCWLRLADEC